MKEKQLLERELWFAMITQTIANLPIFYLNLGEKKQQFGFHKTLLVIFAKHMPTEQVVSKEVKIDARLALIFWDLLYVLQFSLVCFVLWIKMTS